MASRMTCRSSFRAASLAFLIEAIKLGMATAASTPMISITIISSTRVKPASDFRIGCVRRKGLPVRVFRSVEGNAICFRKDVEDILTAPGVAVRVVLHRSQPPVVVAIHWIDRDMAQETQLLPLH